MLFLVLLFHLFSSESSRRTEADARRSFNGVFAVRHRSWLVTLRDLSMQSAGFGEERRVLQGTRHVSRRRLSTENRHGMRSLDASVDGLRNRLRIGFSAVYIF